MNKIYNNLSIANLTNTEWFNQFNLYEQEEIIWGLEANLDVSFYAKPGYNWKQMMQIRKGLENNLDVFIYAKPEFHEAQMHEIRLGLLKNLNVSIYAKSTFSSFKMKITRERLENEQKNI